MHFESSSVIPKAFCWPRDLRESEGRKWRWQSSSSIHGVCSKKSPSIPQQDLLIAGDPSSAAADLGMTELKKDRMYVDRP